MATIIDLNSITDGTLVNNEWVGTGAFDTLIAAVNKNIELQYQKGRLTGNDYAQVYLGGMQAVLQQAINYAMNVDNSQAQADLTYAQVEGVYAENMLKAKELEIKEQQLYLAQKELEIKEQMLQEELYKNSVLLPDQHNENLSKLGLMNQQKLTEIQQTAKATYEVATLLPDQHSQNMKQLEAINKDIDVKERSTVIQEKQSVQDILNKQSQKSILDQQKLTEVQQTAKATYENSTLLPDQHNENSGKILLLAKQANQADVELLVTKQKVVGKAQSTQILE